MNLAHITDSLAVLFAEQRLVFWYDPDAAFLELLPELDLPDVTLLRLDEQPALGVKVRLELEDPQGKYLLYAPSALPDLDEDWLLDIRLYSRVFSADPASLLLDELGLSSLGLREHIAARGAFFRNKERVEKLKRFVAAGPTSEEDEQALDLKMLAVLVRAEQTDLFSVLMRLFATQCGPEGYAPAAPSFVRLWREIEKMSLAPAFWTLLRDALGYEEESPSLYGLLLRLFVTEFCVKCAAAPPQGWLHLLLDADPRRRVNATLLLDHWRNHLCFYTSYDSISRFFGAELRVAEMLDGYGLGALLGVMTFEAVERRIVALLRDEVLGLQSADGGAVAEVIQRRRDGHWASPHHRDDPRVAFYCDAYDALQAALALFQLRWSHDRGLSFATAEDMFNAYARELFRFDQLYRQLHFAADRVERAGPSVGPDEGADLLKALVARVESCYSGWFLDQLALCWDDFLGAKPGEGVLGSWRLERVERQEDFYQRFVQSHLAANPRNKAFVIVSDALRFEAAEELTRAINGRYRFQAKLRPLLGVAPSYTALGMAALLPHRELSFKAGSADVLVDGALSSGLENRNAILRKVNGIALKAEEVLAMSKEEGRARIKDFRVVYIYHDCIDAVGDKAASEGQTFQAVRQAIEELAALARVVVNTLNGGYVLVTADHGFVFQDRALDRLDKHALTPPPGALLSHKRFVLGKGLGEAGSVFYGKTGVTAGIKAVESQADVEFWAPRGYGRFNFVGGARFMHGGLSLQELVIPLITIREARGRDRENSETRKVGVRLLGGRRKIVSSLHRFEFIQTEPVSERVKPLTLRIALRDGGELLSDEARVTFESASASLEERKKSVTLTLKGRTYDPRKEYSLVLRDAENDVELERESVFIDMAFIGDF